MTSSAQSVTSHKRFKCNYDKWRFVHLCSHLSPPPPSSCCLKKEEKTREGCCEVFNRDADLEPDQGLIKLLLKPPLPPRWDLQLQQTSENLDLTWFPVSSAALWFIYSCHPDACMKPRLHFNASFYSYCSLYLLHFPYLGQFNRQKLVFRSFTRVKV